MKQTYSDSDIYKLETQVFWSGGLAADVLKRAASLDAETSSLYEKIFHRRRIEFTAPNPPMAEKLPLDSFQYSDASDVQLSIVVTTRNDLHSHRMVERTQSFIDGLFHLATRFERKIEIVIVEWNPPSDRASLAEEYSFPREHPFASVVIVTVGDDIHQKYKMAELTPLYQMIAKNVGIRRARGNFILATNIDILFSPQLFLDMTSDHLEGGKIYRSHRADICASSLDLGSAAEIIERAPDFLLRTHYQEGPVEPGKVRPKKKNFHDLMATLDIQCTPEDDKLNMSVDGACCFFICWDSLPYLHYQQCGDFQLMHRDDWMRVRGYMELDSFIFHLDSLLALTCYHAGIKEHVFEDASLHYHLDHKTSEEFRPGYSRTNKGKIIRHLSIYDLWAMDRAMTSAGTYYLCNREDWGASGLALETTVATKAPWAANHDATLQEGLKDTGASTLSCYVQIDTGANDAVNKYKSLLEISYDAFENAWIKDIIEDIRIAYDHFSAYISDRFADKRVKIWGTGNRGRYLLLQLQQANIPVAGFVSSDAEQHATFEGYDVQSPAMLDMEQDCVLVASMFATEISETLQDMGAKEGRSFLVAP
jgi:hypothetical protein